MNRSRYYLLKKNWLIFELLSLACTSMRALASQQIMQQAHELQYVPVHLVRRLFLLFHNH